MVKGITTSFAVFISYEKVIGEARMKWENDVRMRNALIGES